MTSLLDTGKPLTFFTVYSDELVRVFYGLGVLDSLNHPSENCPDFLVRNRRLLLLYCSSFKPVIVTESTVVFQKSYISFKQVQKLFIYYIHVVCIENVSVFHISSIFAVLCRADRFY